MTHQQQVFYTTVLPTLTKNGPIVSRQDILTECKNAGINWPPPAAWIKKAGRGTFDLSHLTNAEMGLIPNGITSTPYVAPVDDRTDEEIETEIQERFDALDRMAFGVIAGTYRAMIASGNAGIGKTYSLEYILEGAAMRDEIKFTSVKGYVKPTGIYKLLWECRFKNCVLMFDDADSVFDDEIGLNLLKGALDTTKRRTISWRSEKQFEAEDGEAIPNSFDFEGSVIFITNKNFDREIMRQSKLTPHMEALISRSYYVDLNLRDRDLMVRIKSVVFGTDMLDGVSVKDRKFLVEFMEEHLSDLRELSLRMALKLAALLRGAGSRDDFKKMAKATCLKRRG